MAAAGSTGVSYLGASRYLNPNNWWQRWDVNVKLPAPTDLGSYGTDGRQLYLGRRISQNGHLTRGSDAELRH
ncbi:hypothetical protein V5799_025674 [Amblyomma americanum]|uniref:Uncharacterized protein n=1 Tax=Amblyomma americanum TaxID=6943 RepID=A0AAQ4E8Y1_AMBAM